MEERERLMTSRSVGSEIAAARRRLKLSQADLSQMTGVSSKTIHNYENGNTVPSKAWLALASQVLDHDLMSPAGYEPIAQTDPMLEGIRRVLTNAIHDIEELLRRHRE